MSNCILSLKIYRLFVCLFVLIFSKYFFYMVNNYPIFYIIIIIIIDICKIKQNTIMIN